MKTFLEEHIAVWKSIGRHGAIVVPAIILVLSFLYDTGFIDLPATQSQIKAIDLRVSHVEKLQDGVGGRLKNIEDQVGPTAQKVDDMKTQVDRLVGALIDDGVSRRQKDNYGKQ